MKERLRSIVKSPTPSRGLPSGPRLGLNVANPGGPTQNPTSPRVAQRISRRWEQIAPLVRLSLPAGSTLETSQEEHFVWLTGLLRAGLDMRRIVRLRLDDVRVSRADREALLKKVLEEKRATDSVRNVRS